MATRKTAASKTAASKTAAAKKTIAAQGAAAKKTATAKSATRPAAKSARPDPHQAVSNEPEAAPSRVVRNVSKPPAEGSAPRVSKPGLDGAEAVQGFMLMQETGAAETAAPDTEGLPDIGEASFGPPPRAPRARCTAPTTACRSPTPRRTRGGCTPRC